MPRLAASVLFLSCLVGCGNAEAPSETVPEPVAAAPPVPEPETFERFVLASRLNLRERPRGRKIGHLLINSPVTVLEVQEDRARVRVANGKEGWVAVAFLTEEPITVSSAVRAAKASTRPEERLAWAQRAAALDFRSPEVLGELASAYRGIGDTVTAAQIESQLMWPVDLLLAGAHTPPNATTVRLEWASVPWEELGTQDPRPTSLTESEMARKGVEMGAEIWILPTKSAAVKGVVTGMKLIVFNECGGQWGWVIEATATLPKDEVALAYTRQAPPDSWTKEGPSVDINAVEAAVLAAMPLEVTHQQVHVVPYGSGARARVGGNLTEPTDDAPTYGFVDYQVDAAGNVTELGRTEDWTSYIGFQFPLAGRDFDGDGNLDLFTGGMCSTSLQDHEGVSRAESAMTCCGC